MPEKDERNDYEKLLNVFATFRDMKSELNEAGEHRIALRNRVIFEFSHDGKLSGCRFLSGGNDYIPVSSPGPVEDFFKPPK